MSHVLVNRHGLLIQPLQVFCDDCAVDGDDHESRMACWMCAGSVDGLVLLQNPVSRTVRVLQPTYLLDELCE